MATIVSVNVGQPGLVEHDGRRAPTAIGKRPVAGRLAVGREQLDGDAQADRSVHGGPDKAVYVYASEDTAWWERELGLPLGPGSFGENLTTAGVDVSGAVIGERWQVGTARLEVCDARGPCWKLAGHLGVPDMIRRFRAALRPGAYLRVLVEGEIGAGDDLQIVERPGHGVTVADVARIQHFDRSQAATLLVADRLAPGMRAWALEHAREEGTSAGRAGTPRRGERAREAGGRS